MFCCSKHANLLSNYNICDSTYLNFCGVRLSWYKSEGRGFDSRWYHWNFSLTSFRPHCGLGFGSASKRNEHQEYFLMGKDGHCVGLTTLPPSCANCLEIWEPQPPEPSGSVQGCNGIALPLSLPFTAYLKENFTIVP